MRPGRKILNMLRKGLAQSHLYPQSHNHAQAGEVEGSLFCFRPNPEAIYCPLLSTLTTPDRDE